MLDPVTLDDIADLFTRTWMELYWKSRICSNNQEVEILDRDGNVVVTVPKEWNNIKILKSITHFDPAGVDSTSILNYLLVGLDLVGDEDDDGGALNPEDIICGDDDD